MVFSFGDQPPGKNKELVNFYWITYIHSSHTYKQSTHSCSFTTSLQSSQSSWKTTIPHKCCSPITDSPWNECSTTLAFPSISSSRVRKRIKSRVKCFLRWHSNSGPENHQPFTCVFRLVLIPVFGRNVILHQIDLKFNLGKDRIHTTIIIRFAQAVKCFKTYMTKCGYLTLFDIILFLQYLFSFLNYLPTW